MAAPSSSSWQRVSRPSRAEVYRRFIEREVASVDEAAVLLAMVLDASRSRFSADAVAQLHNDLARLLHPDQAPASRSEPEPSDSELEAVTPPRDLATVPSSPTTPAPAVPSPTIPAPTVPSPTTPAPTVPSSPTTPAPTVPSPTTPSPTTPAPTVPSPTTPSPAVPSPATSAEGLEASADGALSTRDLPPTNGAEDWNIKAITSSTPSLLVRSLARTTFTECDYQSGHTCARCSRPRRRSRSSCRTCAT